MKRLIPILKSGRGKSRATQDVTANEQERKGGSGASSSNPATTSTAKAKPLAPGNALAFPDGISVWHDNPDATVDVCFVHGLTGNRDSTWTAHGQPGPWPKTFLPSVLPSARLLTYGYDAYIVQKTVASTNRLIDHASNLLNDLCNASSRPLIFVVHSLGGLVCKKAILLSQNSPEPHLRDLSARVIGIAFMGTPHKGSWMADWAGIPASALGLFKSSNKSLLETLETKNQLLESIQDDFLSMVRRVQTEVKITCFFEELPLLAGLVVSRDSATIGGYTSISIHANHRDMVRFTSSEDAGFQRLLGELKRWEGLAAPIMKTRRVTGEAKMLNNMAANPADAVADEKATPYYYIPFLRNKRFVGREETLDQLVGMFFTHNETQKAAVVGLGGVGKTQVALKFAYWVKDNKPDYSIFWVPVLSRATFEQVYVELANQLPIKKRSEDEDTNESVRRYLSSEAAGPWLLVVDNADDPDILFGSSELGFIDQYLPESEYGLTLFTTRSREVAVSVAGSDIIELQEMNSVDASSLLKKSLVQKASCDAIESATLLKELAYLPLAITQAAAYLNSTGLSITKYLGLLRGADQDTVSLMSREFHDGTRYRGSRNAVASTWLVSFDQIRKSDKSAADLLSFMSCIEPKGIPQSMLPLFEFEEQTAHALGTLCGYAFLSKRGDDNVFDMHSLVHLATRIWVQRQGWTATAAEMAIRHLVTVFPDDDYENRSLWREYFQHVFRALQHGERLNMEEKSNLCYWVGRCLQVDGRIKEAVKYLGEACQWRNNHLAEDHPDRLASQHVLAIAYQANGQIKEAVELLEYIVVIQEMLAEDHPNRLASQHELARAYVTNGQIKKAVELLKHVVAIREMLAEDHSDRLASQHVLAGAYEANGQIKKAIELLEHIVAIEAKVLAEDHPFRLASQHELARAYIANGQIKKAVELFEHIVAIKAKVLAENHPFRLASQHELARAYQANGQIKKAVELLEHVVAIREMLAENHPDRLASQHVLAGAYEANGQIKKAIELLEHIVAIREMLAEDHPFRLASQHELAKAYQANGQIKKAVELLEHVVAIREMLAEDHPDRLASQHVLAIAYQANGQIKEAVELFEYIVVIQEMLAENHPSRLASQHELARAYVANGQIKKAVELLEHIVAIREMLAEDHPDRLASQHVLAGAYEANGQIKEAVELLKHVVVIREMLAEDHPSRLASQHELAIAYEANGQIKEAVELLEYIVAIETKVLAENHPSRLASQHELARAYVANGQIKKAVELLEHVVAIREMLAEDHPDRLASQHVLAITYRANGQTKEAVELLEHVVAIKANVLAENHPSRLVSQQVLSDILQRHDSK